MRKKMSEKKRQVQWRLEWATAHFLFVMSHDTVDCIVTQGAQQARMAWPGVSRDTKIVSWLGATVCVAIWRSKATI